MREKLRYVAEIKVNSEDKKADLIRAVMFMHTKYVSTDIIHGFIMSIRGKFYCRENAEVAQKEINERFFN